MNLIFSLNIHGYPMLAMLWNVFLILIPCWTVYFVSESVGKRHWNGFNKPEKASFAFLFLFWLFFFPNTAYQFMIPRHLVNYCPHFDLNRVCDHGSWVVIFFFFYALIGLPAFYYALNRMAGVLSHLFGHQAAQALPIVTIPLTTVGVMLGLFLRANSWDVLTQPFGLIQTVFGYLSSVDKLAFFGLFTLVLYLIYYGTASFIRHMTPKP